MFSLYLPRPNNYLLVRLLLSVRLLVFLLLCALALTSSVHAQTDLAIYSDSLLNSWQNWSWAAVDLNTKNPVHSGSASTSVTADAYKAIYLHHDVFDTSAY